MNTLDLQTGSQNGTRLYAGGLVYQEQGENSTQWRLPLNLSGCRTQMTFFCKLWREPLVLLLAWFFHLEQGPRPFAAFSVLVGRDDAKHFLRTQGCFSVFYKSLPVLSDPSTGRFPSPIPGTESETLRGD